MSHMRNDKSFGYSVASRTVRFSILTTNPIIIKKISHDTETKKYTDNGKWHYQRRYIISI